MRILKFGGKSLATLEKVQNIGKYIKKIYKKDKNIIIVVSAIGNTTDSLLAEAKEYGDIDQHPRELDVLLSTGETKSAALLCILLNSIGVPAKSLLGFQLKITTFGAHQNSRIAHIGKQPILECFKHKQVVVVAGFQGINKNGDITTLGRGGSDTTACALSAVFDTPAEIYSDFDGVFCGDPRLMHYKKLKHLNYNTLHKLALAGAKVIDHRAVAIAQKFNTPIISKASHQPACSGTTISNLEDDVVAISSKNNLAEITIVFSNESKMKFIMKNVINGINGVKLYNLTLQNNKISFIVENDKLDQILKILSKKLNLLK